jgi:hypothetical protein
MKLQDLLKLIVFNRIGAVPVAARCFLAGFLT